MDVIDSSLEIDLHVAEFLVHRIEKSHKIVSQVSNWMGIAAVSERISKQTHTRNNTYYVP